MQDDTGRSGTDTNTNDSRFGLSTRRAAIKSIGGMIGLGIGTLTVPELASAGQWYAYTNKHSGKVMEVARPHQNNGDNVQQGIENGSDYQKWDTKILQQGSWNGAKWEVMFENKFSGKVLEVEGWSEANGANIQQWDWHGGDSQRWYVNDQKNWIRNKHSGKVMEVDGWSNEDGANIQQWDWHGGNNQRWL